MFVWIRRGYAAAKRIRDDLAAWAQALIVLAAGVALIGGIGLTLANTIFESGTRSTSASPAIAALGCPSTGVRPGETITCVPRVEGEVDSYSWAAPNGSPAAGDAEQFSTVFDDADRFEVTLEVCNGAGCATLPGTITVSDPPTLREARLTMELRTDDWADLETERTSQGFISTTIGQSADIDLYLERTPGGLILWGGSTLNETSTPTLSMAEGDLSPAGWSGCKKLLDGAPPRGVLLANLGGAYVCLVTSDDHIAEFRVLEHSASDAVISYTVWE